MNYRTRPGFQGRMPYGWNAIHILTRQPEGDLKQIIYSSSSPATLSHNLLVFRMIPTLVPTVVRARASKSLQKQYLREI